AKYKGVQWTPFQKLGGASRDRTGDLLHAMQALSQLSYSPKPKERHFPCRGLSCQGNIPVLPVTYAQDRDIPLTGKPPTGKMPLLRLGAIAQLGERLHGMQEVAGSIPASSTKLLKGRPLDALILCERFRPHRLEA